MKLIFQCSRTNAHHFEPKFITGDATEYSKHLFRVLDTDKDNMVSWREVMVGFHQLSPSGDPDQKLKLVYSVSKYSVDSIKRTEHLTFH